MTNPMDFFRITGFTPEAAQKEAAQKAKQAPDMLAFAQQLDSYLNKTPNISQSALYPETQKLDRYISLQAQEIYKQNVDFKPRAIKIPSFQETMKDQEKFSDESVEKLNRFHNLQIGAMNEDVKELQKLLIKWHPKMRRFLAVNGIYNERTAKAVALFQSIYGLEANGAKVDLQTSKLILGVKDGSFWKFDPDKAEQYHPEKTVSGKVLYSALCDLGKPYHLGGDGEYTTDCAMLTRRALIGSDAATNAFKADPSTRMADIQYMHAEQGKNNLALVKEPKPGDLIFFKNTSYQSGIAYKRVTHVGIYVNKDTMLAASPYHGGVTLQNINEIDPGKVAGYGRLTPQTEAYAAADGKPVVEGI